MKLAEKLSQCWLMIQGNLFPWLQEELGPLTEKQQQLITALELTRIELFIPSYHGYVGRPQDDRCAIARSFVAKAIYNMGTTSQLLERVVNCYDLMDAAYDAQIIRDHSQSLGHVPLIDFNNRHESDTREFSPHEKQRYKERSTAERVNARLKDEFGAMMIRVRGHAKVMTHLMFGVIALTVDQLMRFAT